MDSQPDVIRGQIEQQRTDLARNIRELEGRVKNAADWRLRFQRQPAKLMGAALAAGVIFGWLTRPPSRELRDCRCQCD